MLTIKNWNTNHPKKKNLRSLRTASLQKLIPYYAEKDVPQPQPPVAFGFSNVKPEPIMFVV